MKRKLTPLNYPVYRITKKTPEIRRLTNIIMRALPEKDSPEFLKLKEEIGKLSTTNCWFVEYEVAKFLIRTFQDYKNCQVQQ